MIEVAQMLRKGYIARLASLTYLGTPIPVFDTFEKSAATPPVSSAPGMQAYVLLKDITVDDDSPKCDVNQNVSIQMQVVTKFNSNTGESLHSELIGSAALQLVTNGQSSTVVLDAPAHSWLGVMQSSRQINSETATNRIFSRNYLFTHKISQ